jgi:dihydroneopterin aldolase
MDIIYLHELRIDAIIGVAERERRNRQTVTLDIDLGADIRPAAATDSVQDTVNYRNVAERVSEFVKASEFRLIESLAESVAGLLQREFRVAWCRVRVSKQGVLRGVRDVGVIIERGRNA